MGRATPELESVADEDNLSVVALVWARCGEEAARKLCSEAGGGRIYIPATPAPHHTISKILGIEAALWLSEELGGESFDVAIGTKFKRAELRAGIARLTAEKRSVAQICRALNCSRRSVYAHRARLRRLKSSTSPKAEKC